MSQPVHSTALARIETTIVECSVENTITLTPMGQLVALAAGMRELRAAFTDALVQDLFMPLQNSALGFCTDAKEKGYPIHIVRDCMIEGLLRGFRPVGNEINIIAGRAYFTKEGFSRKVAEFPGLTDLRFSPGVPHQVGDKGALVPYSASWRLHGAPDQIVCDLMKNPDGSTFDMRIPVKVNSGMGMDALLGKARRKILAMIWERLAGVNLAPMDGDVDGDAGQFTAPDRPVMPPGRVLLKSVTAAAAAPPAPPPPGRQPGEDL